MEAYRHTLYHVHVDNSCLKKVQLHVHAYPHPLRKLHIVKIYNKQWINKPNLIVHTYISCMICQDNFDNLKGWKHYFWDWNYSMLTCYIIINQYFISSVTSWTYGTSRWQQTTSPYILDIYPQAGVNPRNLTNFNLKNQLIPFYINNYSKEDYYICDIIRKTFNAELCPLRQKNRARLRIPISF